MAFQIDKTQCNKCTALQLAMQSHKDIQKVKISIISPSLSSENPFNTNIASIFANKVKNAFNTQASDIS